MDVRSLSVSEYRGIVHGIPRADELPASSERFMLVAAAVRCALDMLHSIPGRRALKFQTMMFAQYMTQVPCPRLRNLPEDDYKHVVAEFLAAVADSFPRVLLSTINGMETANGRTSKLDCDMPFRPQKCLVIEVNGSFISAMQTARRHSTGRDGCPALQDFHTFLCRLSIALAHELCHVYTLFLLQQKGGLTPPDARYGPQGNTFQGEAGRYMERNIFDGYIDMRCKDESLTSPTIAVREATGNLVWTMKYALIKQVLQGDFSWFKGGSLTDEIHDLHGKLLERGVKIHHWISNSNDFFPDMTKVVRKGPQKLTQRDREYLVGQILRRGFVRGSHLRSFALQPRSQLPPAQVQQS